MNTFNGVKTAGEQMLELLRTKLNVELGFDRAAVAWLDGYIERNRLLFSEDGQYRVAVAIGYIVGEATVRHFGGTWEYVQERQEWLVNFGSQQGMANPIAKARKQLANDASDSIEGFYDVVGRIVEAGSLDNLVGKQTGGKTLTL